MKRKLRNMSPAELLSSSQEVRPISTKESSVNGMYCRVWVSTFICIILSGENLFIFFFRVPMQNSVSFVTLMVITWLISGKIKSTTQQSNGDKGHNDEKQVAACSKRDPASRHQQSNTMMTTGYISVPYQRSRV